MVKSNSKRKKRSNKFPLTLHSTGQYCKKIRGKLYYFGTDKRKALERYLKEATDLHSGRVTHLRCVNGEMTLRSLCNFYLEHQLERVNVGDLTERYYADQVKSLRNFASHIGPSCWISSIRTIDLQNYRNMLIQKYGTPSGANLNIAIMKAMFNWAKKNDILQTIPNIDAVAKLRNIKKEKSLFNSREIRKLVIHASNPMRAMIWLGLNCGFGCTDCAELKWEDLNLESGRVNLNRKKTGIARNLPLWPETIDALKSIPKLGELVFYTKRGNPWVRIIKRTDGKNVVRYSRYDAISAMFSKLLKKSGIKTERGVNFYTLRRMAATLTARSGDPFAVQRLLGHADLKMAMTYVQNISEQTDRAINNTRKLIIQDDSSPLANASSGKDE
ncbi:MAG: phage integrase family protein [Planctomycetes bacterium]|nr:phage integrase family protein [Planctomycetota bacterium]